MRKPQADSEVLLKHLDLPLFEMACLDSEDVID